MNLEIPPHPYDKYAYIYFNIIPKDNPDYNFVFVIQYYNDHYFLCLHNKDVIIKAFEHKGMDTFINYLINKEKIFY